MPVPTLSFLLGLVVVAYLFTFVLFAILRIVTGVSVQRVGYTGLRRIAFSPRNGLKINLRGVGLSIHRPTFALPTWCSLVITELVVTVDLRALDDAKRQQRANGNGKDKPKTSVDHEDADGHGTLWRQLTAVKEKIKRLHRQIGWLRLLDLIATAVTLNVVGVASLRMERLTLSVDTRSQTVDRSRLFQHHKHRPETQCPAEWKSLIRSVLFTPEGRESTEMLDYCTLNIHGMLHRDREGLRDASIALKLGRVNLPYDDIEHAKRLADLLRGKYAQPRGDSSPSSEHLAAVVGELEDPGSRDQHIVRAVSDSRAFIASVLRGIQEVQFAVGFVGLSKKLGIKAHGDRDVYFNFAMKELGLDLLRLDPKSPAHRMYFSTKDVAHQGLLTGIAISAGIDDGNDHPERMLYVPMVTATVKTTLPSRTIHASKQDGPTDRNTNMLYANFVCTSPSVDLDPKHLPLVREMMKHRSGRQQPRQPTAAHHALISQLLPKAHVKFSVQEPVVRISLPPMDKKHDEEDDFDLLISSVSSIALEVESSHATDDRMHYSLNSYYRHSRHKLYYQSAAGDRHDLLYSDFVETQIDINAIPEVSVVASGRAQSFTVFLVRPDICEGVRQVVNQFRKNVLASHHTAGKPQASFLRKVPTWLEQAKFEGSDFGLELAGVDEQVSKDTRGFGLQLESWTTEYKAHRDEDSKTTGPSDRRMSITRSPQKDKDKASKHGDLNFHRKRYHSYADGRRLTFHIQNLEGLIVDSIDDSEPESFLSLPRFEIALSTSTDAHGPIFHVNSFAKSIILQYSLYNHFAIGVAAMVIKKTFLDREKEEEPRRGLNRVQSAGLSATDPQLAEIAGREITAVDFKANLVQVKAKMPADPPMMLQIYYLETGRHRWSSPFLRTKLARLHVRAPATKAAWSRVVTVKVLRLDLRDVKRKVGKSLVSEQSIDVATEAIRITIPHSLSVHEIFDNITNVVKTSKQLMHHFKTGTNEYILTKEPEGPKHVPRVAIRSQIFIFDIEDSLFESKLGSIYQAGLLEQKQRIAREEAFELKKKRVSRGTQKNSSRLRAQSAQIGHDSRSRSRNRQGSATKRSQSAHGDKPSSQNSHRHKRGRSIRYDAEGRCGISESAAVPIDKAREKLDLYNAQSWKSRIDRTRTFQSQAIKEIRRLVGVSDDLDDVEQVEPILAWSGRPALMVLAITDLGLTIEKPSFPMEELPKFMHSVGKGMPYAMEYGLLLPMNLHLTMSEARVQMRDYPLPMLHIPMLARGQSARLHAMSLRMDFVVAEEFRDIESQRSVNVQVVPPEKMAAATGGFAVDVRRTISAVKTYSDIKMEINTSNPTRISWSTSYQPAIQDTMQVVENFTKPPVDPSDRVGFWDKIRLSFHSRINVAWKSDGDVHFVIKGSRDPYIVTGEGAGLVMVWRDNVSWNIAQDDDPRKFFVVDSGEYILAVPDFNNHARHSQDAEGSDDGSTSSESITKNNAMFKKVVMKLSGKVKWLAGLMFERDIGNGKRTFDFKPHYDVVLKHPDFADGGEYDAYRGFRSHHIHMSIAVAAPHDRDWSVNNLKPSRNYNSVHLSPRFFSHFYSWWSMFSGVMSLPIKQGPLWGVTEKKSKKFGRHMATIKYNLLLSPLYISHVYKHKDAEDYAAHSVSATGLKMRLDSFMLDMHQRREHFDLKGKEGARAKTTSGMRIHQAQLDFISADLRALSANIEGTSAEDIEKANDDTLASLHGQAPLVDMSKFDIPDNDFSWIDMDDFVELDWILPAEADPETKILPLGFAPRFTYFRQTDHHGTIAGDPSRTSPFGDEPTHYCVMSQKNDPRRVQAELIERRLTLIKEKQEQNVRAVGEQELKLVREVSHNIESLQKLQEKVEALKNHTEHLEGKHQFLQHILGELLQRLNDEDPSAVPDLETSEEFFEAHENSRTNDPDTLNVDSAPLADYTSDFNNRFIVHNAQIKWNNSLRNIILRYIHQNSQRRGFVYYMSRRAVKFILDVLEERNKEGSPSTPKRQKSQSTQYSAMSPDADDEEIVQDRIDELLRDGRSFVNAEESEYPERWETGGNGGPTDGIAVEFAALNTYHFRLIAPQVQLQSEKNPKSAVLVTAKGMQLKVVQIMEKDKIDDDVSGLVQRRFNAAADSLQMFVTSTKTFSTEFLHFYSANRYGVKAGTYWPPWVPMEIMFEFQTNPYGFNRVVHRTSASLRYDKYNQLRLKYNDDISGGEPTNSHDTEEAEARMDHVWLEFPHFRAICDSMQYFAMYVIAMDLLLYNEPLEKTRSERLEKIMLASDFSDLTGAPEMVEMLQERIRQLEEIKLHFQVNERFLDRQGWKDRIKLDQELASCEDELFFMMKAITTSQQHVEERREPDNSGGFMHLHIASREIAWHLIRDKGESLIELQLKDATFDRTDNYDGSNYNSMEISRINGYNLLKDALYPEIISPFTDESKGGRRLRDGKMLRVHWLMLEAIAGIPVVDYFEVDLVPLRLQIERDVAKKIFEYIFPGVGGSAFDGGFSPFMVKNMLPAQDEEDEAGREDSQSVLGADTSEYYDVQSDTNGPGSLDARLKPTLTLGKHRKTKADGKGLGISNASNHGVYGFTIFQNSDKSSRNVSGTRTPASRQALSQTNLAPVARSPSQRSLSTMHSTADSDERDGKSKRLAAAYRHSNDDKKKKDKDKDKERPSDDLTQMMSRASNYMTLSYVKIPSMVLCLSYKGQGKRNIEDVHDLVFKMPTLEYRNKTWSNLDLAMQLKKDLVRALISHAGAIVGNKFSHHKPNQQVTSKLRELANRSTFMSPNSSQAAWVGGQSGMSHMPGPADWTTVNSSETSSFVGSGRRETSGRPSSARPPTPSSSMLRRSISYSSPEGSRSDLRFSEEGSVPSFAAYVNGYGLQHNTPSPKPPPSQRLSPSSNANESRNRATSITRHLTGFSDRLRQRQTTTNGNANSNADPAEDNEESKRKSKLLLGPQKLLGRFKD